MEHYVIRICKLAFCYYYDFVNDFTEMHRRKKYHILKRQFIHVKNLRYLLFVLPEYIYTECHIKSVLEQSIVTGPMPG